MKTFTLSRRQVIFPRALAYLIVLVLVLVLALPGLASGGEVTSRADLD